MKPTIVSIFLVLTAALALSAQDAETIIQKYEENQQFDTSVSEGRMLVKEGFSEWEMSFTARSKNPDKSLITFTSEEEYGQKILRVGNEVYIYIPDMEEVKNLKGQELRGSVFGTDLSFEDMSDVGSILDEYTVEFLDSTSDSYIVFLESIDGKVAYPGQKLWIDKSTYVLRKSELYAANDVLLKTVDVIETRTIQGKTIPVRTVVKDALKRNTSTTLVIDEIDVNVSIPDRIFTLRNLRKKI